MELTVQNVYGLLIRSRLMPLDDARTMYERWQKEAKDATNLEQFSKWVVVNQYLTDYQANLLCRGHADRFFLGQYKILERIGKGRMAGVYKAVHELGQMVAIKVLPPSKARDPQLLGRFQREARLALRLKHPNIVRSFQVGQFDDLNYLVMEYLEGETLEDVLQRRGKLPPAEAVRLLYLALMGLQHIHEQGLVHRDMKPANLMLVPVGAAVRPGQPDTTLRCTVKILDIGLGRALFDEGVPEKALDPTLTTEGVLLGTPDYMAPEQARDARHSDIRADVYSLGCVLYHALAGQPPFPDKSILGQMIRHATETAKPLKEFNPAVPDGLQQILNWMLAKDPAQRYLTPERAAQALQVFLASGVEPQVTPEGDPKMKSYLTWLEVENSKAELTLPPVPEKPPSGTVAAAAAGKSPAAPPPSVPAASAPAKPPSGSAPAAAGTPAAPVKAPLLPSKGSPAAPAAVEKVRHKSLDHKRRSKKHKRRAKAAPVASPAPVTATPLAPAAESDKGFDVELVPEPPAAKQRPGPGRWQLTGRDILLFGIGAGGAVLAILVGRFLVWLIFRV